MRILYGVQGTGNGHITRSAVMASEFQKRGATVDYLLSGRDRSLLFNVDRFGDFAHRRGLTFSVKNGRLLFFKTATSNDIFGALKDIHNLNLYHYDLVISDYEPISAWAAKINKVPSIGISHQCAFHYEIPKKGINPAAALLLRWFAPTDINIGLHWHHFGGNILPPIIETEGTDEGCSLVEEDKILVYLPFEQPERVIQLLKPITSHRFFFFTDIDREHVDGHLYLQPFSREHFISHMLSSVGVISGAGFELPSELFHFGKKLLTKPLAGQAEQLSNGAAMLQLGLADVMESLNANRIRDWLDKPTPSPIAYPNVAKHLVDWILDSQRHDINKLRDQLWAKVDRSNCDEKATPQIQNGLDIAWKSVGTG